MLRMWFPTLILAMALALATDVTHYGQVQRLVDTAVQLRFSSSGLVPASLHQPEHR
jgi:hypothetical protein